MFQVKEIKFTPEQLKQHDAEIRKPLEDEIERLKETIRIIDNDTTDGRVKVLKAYIKKLQQDNNNVWDEYLENAPKINMEEKELFKKQERQKVIAELEEWVEDTLSIQAFGKILIEYENIKEKLNEMKGGSNEKEYND